MYYVLDSYRILQSSLDGLVKTVHELTLLKKEYPDKWELLNKKLAYPYEYFKSLDDCDLPVTNLVKEDYFSKLKNGYPIYQILQMIVRLDILLKLI